MIHKNLSAYEGFEDLSSLESDLEEYRSKKIKEINPNIALVSSLFNKKKLRVLELGSGNSKFLFALQESDLLEKGYGVEISKSRYEFAENWKTTNDYDKVTNLNQNALDLNYQTLGELDLFYCVDLAFQFLAPIEKNSDVQVLEKVHSQLAPGGKVILELDNFNSILRAMTNDKVKLWQKFDHPDPWKYMLWDCSFSKENKVLNKKKLFIKRDMSETSASEVDLRIYSCQEAVDLLKSVGFVNLQILPNWSPTPGLEDEFIVIGEKSGSKS